jgi:polyhydroxyalkanoate synthesis repressor PhaR
MAVPGDQNKGNQAKSGDKSNPVRIKKYANRRLYNTATSSYVTLDYLAQMVREGLEFTVEDAKSGEDITRSVLTQIIVEEESKGQNMLPINFLRQLISLYGDNLQFLVPGYLEKSMESFGANQDQIRQYMKDNFANVLPLDRLEEMSKQNMAFFQQAMSMWNPFKVPGSTGPQAPGNAAAPEQNAGAHQSSGRGSEELSDLKSQMQALQRQLEQLTKAGQKAD